MTTSTDRDLDTFERQRPFMRGLAYRMLGSRADAEDVVQDCWLRWQATGRDAVRDPRAFLATTATRLCLDRLKSARARRETYPGNWLPEPTTEALAAFDPGPEAATELADELSYAFLVVLETLSAPQRAAFLLHDVFDLEFAEIARLLGRTEPGVRQLATRARRRVRGQRPRHGADAALGSELAQAFAAALDGGDPVRLASLLAEDCRFVSDGGGRVASVPRPLYGRDRVAKVLLGFARLQRDASVRRRPCRINGDAGFVYVDRRERVVQAMALELGTNGRVNGVFVQRNPDKLSTIRLG